MDIFAKDVHGFNIAISSTTKLIASTPIINNKCEQASSAQNSSYPFYNNVQLEHQIKAR